MGNVKKVTLIALDVKNTTHSSIQIVDVTYKVAIIHLV